MPNHEPPNRPPEHRDPASEGAEERPEGPPREDARASSQPRDLAQRVWGSWPNLPAGAAPAAEPAPPPAPAAAPPELELTDADVEEERFDSDLLRLEDRLRDTEDRLASFAESMQQALRSLADTIRASTADLPGVIEGIVERRLNAVGDALLKLADLRAKLQEETGEAVQGLRASFQALEERLAETTQQRVQASIDQLSAEVRGVREEVASTVDSGVAEGRVLEAVERRLRDRIAELPTRGDFASIRGAIGTVASSLRDELADAIERIGRIEESLAAPGTGGDLDGDVTPEPSQEPDPRPSSSDEISADDSFDSRPVFDFPER